MSETKLEIIERVAQYVIEDENSLKSNLRAIQKPKHASDLRRALLRLEEKNLREGKEKPLFTLEEYAVDLFPDGGYWGEVRDLLLVAIYQKMHELKIPLDEEVESKEEQLT